MGNIDSHNCLSVDVFAGEEKNSLLEEPRKKTKQNMQHGCCQSKENIEVNM
jgi:hypothetical protein